MKKFLSILLALVMVLSLGTTAFAAEDDTPADPNSKLFSTVEDDAETTDVVENAVDFQVKTVANVIPNGAYANIKYSVKVEWTVDTTSIDINSGDVYDWNPVTYQYEKNNDASDSKIGAGNSVDVEIKLFNRSNADVAYTIEYADTDDDVYTTEAGAKVEGKLESADTIVDVATAAAAGSFDYDIAYANQGEQTGTEQTAEYKGTVTVTAISNTTGITDNSKVVLGAYTVTLGKYEAPAPEPVVETKTVQEILNTVDGGFPTSTVWYSVPENAWVSDASKKCFYVDGTFVYNDGNNVTASLSDEVNKDEEGNYKMTGSALMGDSFTITFVMNDNVLQSIKIDYHTASGIGSTSDTFAPAAE